MTRTNAENSEDAVPTQAGGVGEPDSPTELGPRDWFQTLKRTAVEMKQDRVTLTAGGLAYYWFLALFPALIGAVGMIALLQLDPRVVQDILDGIRSALPPGASSVLSDAVNSATESSTGAGRAAIIGLVIALWSASSGMGALQDGLNVAYDVPEDRKFLPKRAIGILMLLLMLLFGVVPATLILFWKPLGEFVNGLVPLPSALFDIIWLVAIGAVAIMSLSVMFAALYFLGPKRPSPRWQWVSPGGIIAVLIWLAATVAFQFYVTEFGKYAKTYGALAGVVILILWLFITALAVLIGGELNAELERQAAIRREKTSTG
ncbi:MAG: YihY/virulence factor BrkB family protein [Actinomycetota bacterium]|nr:YihY/virulence factor BrkB family protein [Actinomycetota bacterium]